MIDQYPQSGITKRAEQKVELLPALSTTHLLTKGSIMADSQPSHSATRGQHSAITFIYGLFDPFTHELKYLGRTRHLERRHYQHCTKPHGEIREWVQSLRRRGSKPEIRVLAECEGDGVEQEQQHIRKAFADGISILNERIANPELTSIVQVRMSRDLIDDCKIAARSAGLTLSEWIGQQCFDALPANVRKKLPERPPANRPKKED